MLEPDDFKNDPYGYVTNQMGHFFVGFSFTTIYCFVLEFIAFYPNQTVAAAVIMAIYFFWWELGKQGWQGWDTIEDTAYVSSGASLYVFIDMSFVIDKLAMFCFALWFSLLLGMLRRL